MQKISFFIVLAGVAFVCGCDKETRQNTQKIDGLTQKMFILQQEQARQLAEIRAQLASVPVQVNNNQLELFVKGQEKALFYQTNALFLLLAVDKNIQTRFQEAVDARATASQQAYMFHTNETDLAVYCATQTAAALGGLEKRIVADLSAELQRAKADLGNSITNQIRQLAADQSKADQLKVMAAELGRIRSELELLKASRAATNPPFGGMR